MSRNGPRVAAAVVLAAVLVGVSGCSDSSEEKKPKAGGTKGAEPLKWGECEAPTAAEGGGQAPSKEWQCATLHVPLDYAKPEGETIPIALIRAKARDKGKRIGSLVFNFGGPGGSGISTLPGAAKEYAALRERYDLVSFDPRGVGRSAPVRCEGDRQLDAYYAQDSTPGTPQQEKAFVDNLRKFQQACERNSRKVLPYVGTENAARDLDRIRQALGDEKLNYFGISYGTELGGVYAHLFPKNVGRAVFDAVVDPTKTSEEGALGQAKGFQLALGNFAQDCVNRGDECRLQGSTAKEIEANIVKLQKDLAVKPIAGIGGRMLTDSAATNGIAQALYSKQLWPLLEQGLDEADGGQGQLLMALSDALNGRDQQGHYSNIGAANTAINCVDSKDRYTLEQTKSKLPAFRSTSPVFGDFLGWALMSCTDWPVPGAWETPDVSAPGSAPILVIGNTGDPATPYEGARRMVERLGPGVGVELTYKGEGHGAYNSGDKCVQKAVNAYLLDGKVPGANTVCTATQNPTGTPVAPEPPQGA
ncbi:MULTISPECIES: alpha/beta hydrolase [unclassified Streptomyces]|uniref:alpha/beta hydrolase n=1 Tax=unclassified Streptomyces TaxID=2593676 RepID=UPI001BEBD1F9|nr:MULTISPECIES: alpha/beta hydrolase [unclassified Streptomyces]MBT2402968.1 alpha/beta fold hydrolase [Streptomyces sp. ISL-21]MBT2459699.1 alpha/beta fold hydrolase [Streptomyces sp. ISL-86]MBT2609621.1 alpha/beta fold hydrolase [Streptomyces sp. ISL-87]